MTSKEAFEYIESTTEPSMRFAVHLAEALEASEARILELETAARKLLDKLAAIEPHVNSVFTLHFARIGKQYTGPNYCDERDALKSLLPARTDA